MNVSAKESRNKSGVNEEVNELRTLPDE